jgi:hypothetical protein
MSCINKVFPKAGFLTCTFPVPLPSHQYGDNSTGSDVKRKREEMISDGWVVDQEPLILSSKGEEYLKRQARRYKNSLKLIGETR